tara:strand:+ start:40 stop:276 length:237 start_codon:yes stop_codon:yes gene_type:complete
MKIYLSILLLLIIGCGKEEDVSQKESTIKQNIEIELPKIETKIEVDENITRHYLAIGFFDDKNNLENIERYFNGELLK